jgi:hypothetical protein
MRGRSNSVTFNNTFLIIKAIDMKSILFICCLLLPSFLLAQEPINSAQKEIVFKSVNVIPMDMERVIENQDVVVKNGIIISIGNSGKVKYAADAVVINASGKYLMPGLAEMHAHVPPVNDIEPMKEVALLFAVME